MIKVLKEVIILHVTEPTSHTHFVAHLCGSVEIYEEKMNDKIYNILFNESLQLLVCDPIFQH